MSEDRRVPKKPKAMPGIEIRERRRGGSHYQFRVRWKDPATGKRHVEIFDDPQEALDFQAHLRLLHRRGAVSDLNRGRELLSDFATEWFNEWAAMNLTHRTLRDYAGVYNRHLLPRIGHLQLRAIKPRTVDALRSDLEEAKVGAPTIRKALAILQAMFRQAVVWDRVDANPVKPVRKPPARRITVVVPFTVDQIEALLDHLSRNASATDRMLAELIAYSGARPRTQWQ